MHDGSFWSDKLTPQEESLSLDKPSLVIRQIQTRRKDFSFAIGASCPKPSPFLHAARLSPRAHL
jgi:hypothetical protein